MDITLDKWDTAMDSQAKAFLVAVREAVPLMSNGGRIIAISFAPGGRFGSWQPWSRWAPRKQPWRFWSVISPSRWLSGHHRQHHQSRLVEDSVLNSLPEDSKPVFANGKNAAGPDGPPRHACDIATRSH